MVQRLKRLPAMWETWVRSLGGEDPLEKEMATHSSILAWRIPWTEELSGLQSTGRRVGLHFYFLDFSGNISSAWIKVKVAQWFPALRHHRLYTFPGILQTRIPEWVAIPFSRGSSQPRKILELQADSLPAEPPGNRGLGCPL